MTMTVTRKTMATYKRNVPKKLESQIEPRGTYIDNSWAGHAAWDM